MKNCKCREGAWSAYEPVNRPIPAGGREATQGAAEQGMGDGANLDYVKLLGILTSSHPLQKKAVFFLKLERQ